MSVWRRYCVAGYLAEPEELQLRLEVVELVT